jgi:hypothetical protein
MIDFVLEVEKNSYTQTEKYNIIERETKCEVFDKFIKYANFLKTPLKKSMFVPFDAYDNILEEPKVENYTDETGFVNNAFFIETSYFNKAKEKVIFEGFEVYSINENTITNGKIKITFFLKEQAVFVDNGIQIFEVKSIEGLITYNLTIKNIFI